jgi:hypothetical protein
MRAMSDAESGDKQAREWLTTDASVWVNMLEADDKVKSAVNGELCKKFKT